MKVTVEFLSLPLLTKLVGGKSIEVDFDGNTLGELIEHLCRRYGQNFRQFVYDRESGGLEPSLRLLLNGQEWLDRNQLDRRLQPGDRLSLMMLVGGG